MVVLRCTTALHSLCCIIPWLIVCEHQGKCRGQMWSTDVQDFPGASPLLCGRPAELAEGRHPGPLGCCHPPSGRRLNAVQLYADQKWPSDAWRVANTMLSWAIFGSSCVLFIAITTGQALRSLVCLSNYNQSCRVQFSEVSAWATSLYLLEGLGSIKRNHSAPLSPVSCITFGRSESTMVSLYVIYCLKKGMRLEWERCWLLLLPDWRGMYFVSCRTIVQSEEMVQINWQIAHKNKFRTHNFLLMWQITSW